MVIILLAILIAIFFFASCASSGKKYSFDDSKDALITYKNFLTNLKTQEDASADNMTKLMQQWVQLRGTVYNFIEKDSSFHAHTWLSSNFNALDDSIKYTLYEMSSSKDRSVKDIYIIKVNTALPIDDEIKPVIPMLTQFFDSLDTVKPIKADCKETLYQYRTFLRSAEYSNIKSISDLFRLVAEEDRVFKSFLSHINEYSEENLSDITELTERMCESVYRAALDKRLPSSTVVLLMAERANRRLLQNAVACLQSVERKDRLSESQQMAYYWMILQPFISIDRMGMALLTTSQKKELENIADCFQKIETSHLLGKKNTPQTKISDLILKLYISTI